MWNFCGSRIGEVEEYKYLGVTVKAGLNGGFKSMGDRMVDANGVLGMVKYAATRSGSKYVVGREGWKSMVVNKMMYGCGALAWNQHECDDLEVRQNGMGRWLWDVGNELIRGETGWSTFEEREAKAMVKWMLRVVFEENLVSEIGRACLIEIGCKSRWWSRCRHICSKSGLLEFVNLICMREVSVNGMVKLGMNIEREGWKKYICERIQESGRRTWKDGFNDTEREKEYVRMKESPRNESFADGSVGARVRLMVRGGFLPVRGSERMTWKYDDCRCVCGLVETEMHVLFECTLYEEERERWRGAVGYLKDGMDEYELIKG